MGDLRSGTCRTAITVLHSLKRKEHRSHFSSHFCPIFPTYLKCLHVFNLAWIYVIWSSELSTSCLWEGIIHSHCPLVQSSCCITVFRLWFLQRKVGNDVFKLQIDWTSSLVLPLPPIDGGNFIQLGYFLMIRMGIGFVLQLLPSSLAFPHSCMKHTYPKQVTTHLLY